MNEGNPSCIVDLDLTGTSADTAKRIAEALLAVGAVPRVRLAHTGAPAFLRHLPNEAPRWVVGDHRALSSLRAADRLPVTFATLEVAGDPPPAAHTELLEQLFDRAALVFVRPLGSHSGNVACVTGPHLGVDDHDAASGALLPLSPVRISATGELGGRAVWLYTPAELAAVLGAEERLLRFPNPLKIVAPDGRVVREYFGGGTQALAHATAHRHTEIMLGFADGGFDEWYATLEDDAGAFVFPTFAMPVAGALNEEGEAKLIPATRSPDNRVVAAVALLSRDRETLERVLGIQETNSDPFRNIIPLTVLGESELTELVAAAVALFASACGVIAVSALPADLCRRAAGTLAFLHGKHVQRVAGSVTTRRPEVGAEYAARHRTASAQRARKRSRTTQGALANLRAQIDRWLQEPLTRSHQ